VDPHDDPLLRGALTVALRLRVDDARPHPAARARMRRRVLAAIVPARPTFTDLVMTVFAVLAKPAPALLRILAIAFAAAGLLAGATVASADSLPDDALYGFKLAGEQLRLAIANSPEDRAAVDLSIASHRLDEAERLAEAGRDDATIDTTAAFGVSLATAAAELASVEVLRPKLGALVGQVQAQLHLQQDRAGASAARLSGDARTAGAAAALAAVGPRSAVDGAPSAVKIADAAAAVTTRLAVVAQTRASEPSEEDAAAGNAFRTSAVATARPAVHTPQPTIAPPKMATAVGAIAAPVDRAAAREAARRAQHAAEEAHRAAVRARERSVPDRDANDRD
jgi:hypothetical protein